MLLAMQVPLLVVALERLMGGTAERVEERELTDIDLMLVRRLMGTLDRLAERASGSTSPRRR